MVEANDHSSDVLVPIVEDNEAPTPGERANIVEELDPPNEQDVLIEACKVTTIQDKIFQSPGADVEVGHSSPIERTSDATSVRSLPIVQISEPSSPAHRPATARSPDSRSNIVDDSDGGGSRHLNPSRTAATNHERRRSAYIDNRVTNRFSGFLSSLIYRRDGLPTNQARQAVRDGRPESPLPKNPNHPSRSSSPTVPPRPVTPPPALPPPSLHELGLAMSVVTSVLSPSPSSGAYLSPNYLLLCHSQGLDVLPLVSPPAAVPYALVRRVSFKHVVVMEQRGVLVAIAGRRDGVRIYALDEVRKAVEWRIDVEVRRERDRARREEAKRIASGSLEDSGSEFQNATSVGTRANLSRKSPQRVPSVPSSPTAASRRARFPPLPSPQPSQSRMYPDDPPPYSPSEPRVRNNSTVSDHQLVHRPSAISLPRSLMGPQQNSRESSLEQGLDFKPDWLDGRDSSDEEAIDIVAAGVSGSQALDERTSAMAAMSSSQGTHPVAPSLSRTQTSQTSHSSRRRPSNLDLSLTRVSARNSSTPHVPPSPAPTLLTLRQALQSLSGAGASQPEGTPNGEPATPDGDDDDFEILPAPTEHISLTQALMESRLPGLPPIGTRRAQQAILIASHPVVTGEEELPSSRTSESVTTTRSASSSQVTARRRRRWSVLDGLFQGGSDPLPHASEPNLDEPSTPIPSSPVSNERAHVRRQLRRTPTATSNSLVRPSTSPSQDVARPSSSRVTPSLPGGPSVSSDAPARSRSGSRFVPRILANVLNSRREASSASRALDSDKAKITATPPLPPAPAPKLEYVKLPGTKGAIMVKAVETAKKSFLAILCGEHGEKVELFAGTYRTTLGLSRTFILPDSPRSLELQLQGDDLVEVFLVFSQNVFGLEPATVRVREVRIGRAERRAARRRARDREALLDDPTASADPEGGVIEEEPSITLTVSMSTTEGAENETPEPVQPVLRPQQTDNQQSDGATTGVPATSAELSALATAQMSPYTTFQQLSFSPNFPLASIADEYVIPPTYRSFMEYRALYESESNGNCNIGTSQHQLSPPGLPPPVPLPPSKWFYQDPKGVVQGPWKADLMQSWYKDGLLPPDLPVRREEDTGYILLKHLRLQCVDPTQPFGSPLPQMVQSIALTDGRPLLKPISLLAQPSHFGPPALFFSSRGGHSTTIVDGRGRLVLKGRFFWSPDNVEDGKPPALAGTISRMGDVKRLESIDTGDRSILVAMRQGGFEAVDLTDALLRPADGSRTLFPHFNPPSSSFNRRGPFVWRMGTPIPIGTSSDEIVALKPSASRPLKKLSTGPGRTTGKQDSSLNGEVDGDYAIQDEILFLGRKDDALYLCERNSVSFRVLRLSPSVS